MKQRDHKQPAPLARSVIGEVALALLLAATMAPAGAADCPFAPWSNYKGVDLLRTPDERAYLWVTSRTAIDADGAPRAYHPDDVGRCDRTGVGLDCPRNAGYPSSSWWQSALSADPANPNRAFVQTSGEAAGFFVSKTSLNDPDKAERDPARYVDASTVPYVVFPGPFNNMSGTGLLGDVGIARHLRTGKETPFIVADVGPNEPLGEASIALFAALGGEHPNPRTGGGVAPGPTLYLLFPYSVRDRAKAWPVSADERESQAERLLATIGGEATLAACAAHFH